MQRLIASLRHPKVGMPEFELTERAVNCHHNYVARERHCGAGKGEFKIIPGSMGARSFIVRGKGNPDSFESCSHGAGRRMGRKEAARRLDEAPSAKNWLGAKRRVPLLDDWDDE